MTRSRPRVRRRCCSSASRASSSTTRPGRGRDVSHLFRGDVDLDRGQRVAGRERLRLAAAGRQRRRSAPRPSRWPGLPVIRAYHLIPARSLEGARRRPPHAGPGLCARGLHRCRRLARGHGRRLRGRHVLAGRQRARARPHAGGASAQPRRGPDRRPRATAPASTRRWSRRSPRAARRALAEPRAPTSSRRSAVVSTLLASSAARHRPRVRARCSTSCASPTAQPAARRAAPGSDLTRSR